MNPHPLLPPPSPVSLRLPVARIIGVGGAGLQAVEHMVRAGLEGASYAVVHTDMRRLEASTIPAKLLLGAKVTRGLKVGEPEMGRALAEADAHELRHLCEGADLVIVVAGLGGNTASGAAPVLARVARENGALVLALATLPFDFEGRRRQVQARAALQQLRAAADAVICLPNQKITAILDDQTSLTEAMQIIDDLLAKGVRGLLRLLSREGLINVDFSDLCQVVRGRQAESCFATAEAEGENRAREVVERLVRSPLLDAGQGLAQADALLISLTGGPGLSLKDVNLVMEQINRAAEHAQVIMGALIDPALGDRLAVTVVASRHLPAEAASPVPRGQAESELAAAAEPEPPAAVFPIGDVPDRSTGRPEAPAGMGARRYVPPAPELSSEQTERLLGGRSGAGSSRRRGRVKPQQTTLPLEVVSKGRFAKTEPTVHRGEDLDTPAYIRRGVALN